METAATPPQQLFDAEAIAGQQAHWASTFDANPDMYGTDPSAPALAAAEAFAAAGHRNVLELGAGQGRPAGPTVIALSGLPPLGGNRRS